MAYIAPRSLEESGRVVFIRQKSRLTETHAQLRTQLMNKKCWTEMRLID